MLKRPSHVLELLLLTLCAVSPAAAQNKALSVGVGYQTLKSGSSSFPLGVNVDFVAATTRHPAIVGELGWARDSLHQFGLRDTITALHVGAGGRWAANRHQRLKPFGQILVGVEHDNAEIEKFGRDSAWAFLVQPGGGVVVDWGVDFFGQIDWRRVYRERDSANAIRLLVGSRFSIR